MFDGHRTKRALRFASMFEHRRTFAALPSLTAALAWGAMFPIAASALKHIDPYSLTAIRYGVAAVVFLVLLRALEGPLRADGRHRELFVLGSIGFAGFNLLSYAGLERTQPQNAALIVALQPLVAAVGLWLTTRRMPAPATFAAMALALFGVSLVITRGHPGTLLHGGGTVGELMVFAGCVCWITYTLGARRFPEFSPLRYTALSAGYGTLTIIAVAAVVALAGGAHIDSPGAVWWQTLYIIVAGAVVAVLAWNDGVRRIGAANGALFLNLVPVVSFAIAIVVQGYEPNGYELAGALITIGALVLANLAGRRQAITRPSRLAWAATRLANSAKSRP
jgi:drug/metabolite transporter (DMT)-like permease